jgi:hypothetical protein
VKTSWRGGAEEVGVAEVRSDGRSGSLLTDSSSGDGELHFHGRLPVSNSSPPPSSDVSDGGSGEDPQTG